MMQRFICWLILASAMVLAGCRVDAIAPVNLSGIVRVSTKKDPVARTAESTQAMVYRRPTAHKGETFRPLGFPSGVIGTSSTTG